MTDDLLSESRLRERGLFRTESVQRLIAEHRGGRQDWSMQIWQFLTLELWMQNFVDRAPGAASAEVLSGGGFVGLMKRESRQAAIA
jgi:asparagine synthase (glutamine-hydrolysing)